MSNEEFLSTLPKEILVKLLANYFGYHDLEYVKRGVLKARLEFNLEKQYEILREIDKINTNEKDWIKFVESHNKIGKLFNDIEVLDEEYNRLTNELYPKGVEK